MVEQVGSGNNAGITQDGTSGMLAPVNTTITQRGTRNDATIRQNIVSYSPATVEQNGIGNLARVEQVDSGDTRIRTAQNGTGNQLTVSQRGGAYRVEEQSHENRTIGSRLGRQPRLRLPVSHQARRLR